MAPPPRRSTLEREAARRRQRRLVAARRRRARRARRVRRRSRCTRSPSAATRASQARHAESERARSRERWRELETDPELSLLLASEAARRVRSRANEDVLREGARLVARARPPARARGRCRRRRLRAGTDRDARRRRHAAHVPAADGAGGVGARARPRCDPAAFSADGRVAAVARDARCACGPVDGGAGGLRVDAGSPVTALATDAAGDRSRRRRLDGAAHGLERGRPQVRDPPVVRADSGSRSTPTGRWSPPRAGSSRAVWRVGRARPVVWVANRRGITASRSRPTGSCSRPATRTASHGCERSGGDLFADFVEAERAHRRRLQPRRRDPVHAQRRGRAARVYEITGRPVSLTPATPTA